MQPSRDAGSRERILYLLKSKGPRTAAELARALGVTAVAVRQHLRRLSDEGSVASDLQRRPVGRPARVWRLTDAGQAAFPESYAELAVGVLDAARAAFGAGGLERVVRARSKAQLAAYRERLGDSDAPLARRVAALARLRTAEGYMAESRSQRDGSVLLIENHCPICAAADACRGLCTAELELFQSLLGRGVEVERTEYLFDGARRCTYRIRARRRSRR